MIDCLRMLIDPPIEVESSCCESLVGLLTRASSTRSSLPRVPTPVAFVAPALRAYSGVGRAGFAPASQINQTSKLIAQGTGRSQAKLCRQQDELRKSYIRFRKRGPCVPPGYDFVLPSKALLDWYFAKRWVRRRVQECRHPQAQPSNTRPFPSMSSFTFSEINICLRVFWKCQSQTVSLVRSNHPVGIPPNAIGSILV